MKFEFIDNHRSEFAVEKMCRVLDVSRSGYYRWRNAPESDRKNSNEALYVRIKETYDAAHGTYGSPRITRELRDKGIQCSENRVARLMRKKELAAKTKRKFKVTTDSKHDLPVAPNLVEQDFLVESLREAPRDRTNCGYPTSLTSGRWKGGCIWQSSWTSSRARLLAGQ